MPGGLPVAVVSSLIARITSICRFARFFRFHGREDQFQPVDGVLLGLLGRGAGLSPLEQCGGPSHFVDGSRQGHAEDVGRIERLHHPARLVAQQLLLMGQLQEAGDLGAGQRAAALHVGELAGFGRDPFLLAMEVLDGVLQPGLLFHGQLGLNFETLLAEKLSGIFEGFLRLLRPAACTLAIPGVAGAAALFHPPGRLVCGLGGFLGQQPLQPPAELLGLLLKLFLLAGQLLQLGLLLLGLGTCLGRPALSSILRRRPSCRLPNR